MSKKEISIAYLQKIAKEELKEYVDANLNEKSLRQTIQSQLDKSGKDIVFKALGLRWNTWDRKWELDSYGGLNDILKKDNYLIQDIGSQVLKEIFHEITPSDILSSITQTNKNHLKKVYKEQLMLSFEKQISQLAHNHGVQYAHNLFEQYIKEDTAC